MKKTMKRALLMVAFAAVPFAMQAQTKFHDVEANDAKAAVKSITTSIMGQEQTITFTKEGKMQGEGISNPKYDENGYLQSVTITRSMMGQEMTSTYTYKWENDKVVSQSMDMMGQQIVTKRTFNEKGAPASESIDMGGQEMNMPYSDYKYDEKGNWTSRKMSMMGQEMEQTRKIEYYE